MSFAQVMVESIERKKTDRRKAYIMHGRITYQPFSSRKQRRVTKAVYKTFPFTYAQGVKADKFRHVIPARTSRPPSSEVVALAVFRLSGAALCG